MSVLRAMITEYGMQWAINRTLYSCKLKLLRLLPQSERCFETAAETTVQRLDIFDIDIGAIGDFLKALPEVEQSRLMKTADDACDGRICGFSSITLDYGNPINWQKNPLTGKSCDVSKKWFLIPDFDSERGDIKVVWEASRFTHFYALARAYLLTGEEKYYQAFSGQLQNWLEQNPYSFGANYKCGQECALRLINCLMGYSVFAKAGLANATDEANVKDLINRCYRKILGNFFYAYKCIRNNHSISELVGMIVGAWCSKDDKRVEKAYRMLGKVICEQFTENGGYRQFSFNYQRLALQDIECVLSINEKTGWKLNPSAIERIKQSCLLRPSYILGNSFTILPRHHLKLPRRIPCIVKRITSSNHHQDALHIRQRPVVGLFKYLYILHDAANETAIEVAKQNRVPLSVCSPTVSDDCDFCARR